SDSWRVLAACAAACVFLVWCGKKDEASAAQGSAGAPPPMPVTAIRVAPQKVPISLEAVGQAEGSRDVEIRARVSGIIERRLYDEGTTVQPGKVLFVIDPAPYELAVQEARAALMQERS